LLTSRAIACGSIFVEDPSPYPLPEYREREKEKEAACDCPALTGAAFWRKIE
jgi:hypothetical protein